MRRKYNKTEILEKGIQLFREKSYHDTGIDDILKTCKIPSGSFYNFFKNKEGFAIEALKQYNQAYIDYLEEVLESINDGGTIIFNTSVSNVKGMPGVSVYGSSKAALRSIVRALAVELAPRNIRVNAVSPGPIETPLWSKTNLTEEEVGGFAEGVSGQVPLGRFGQGKEVANAVLFLASDEASYITATEVPVDGGMAQV